MGHISSSVGLLHTMEEHMHALQFTYPNMAAPVTVLAGSGSWNLSPPLSAITVIGSGIVTKLYDIHHADIDTISTNGDYQLQFYHGGSGARISAFTVSATRVAAGPREGQKDVVCPKILANRELVVVMASSLTNAPSARVKVDGHTY